MLKLKEKRKLKLKIEKQALLIRKLQVELVKDREVEAQYKPKPNEDWTEQAMCFQSNRQITQLKLEIARLRKRVLRNQLEGYPQ